MGNVRETAPDRCWTTDAFEAQSRMSGWTDIVSRHMTEMDVGSEQPESYCASWRQFGLGALELNFITATPQHIRRTPAMVSRGGSASYELVFMKQGTMHVRYRTGEEFIAESDFALLRNAEPYEFICPEKSVALTAHVSADWVGRWLPSLESFSGLSTAVRQAWGRPLAAMFCTIDEAGLDDIALPREVLADQIGALLGLMTATQGDALKSQHHAMLRRIRALLHERSHEPDLDPGKLARDIGISKRHLHGLFAAAGSTFGRELIEFRLMYAARYLRDARYRALSITEIAYQTGFNDTSHFARRFRGRFGCNPRIFRAEAFQDPLIMAKK